jgi:hypothetical protein
MGQLLGDNHGPFESMQSNIETRIINSKELRNKQTNNKREHKFIFKKHTSL